MSLVKTYRYPVGCCEELISVCERHVHHLKMRHKDAEITKDLHEGPCFLCGEGDENE